MNTTLKEQFFDYLEKTSTTLRSAAKAIGVSPPALSFYKNGTAETQGIKIAPLEAKLEQFLTREQARNSVLSMPTLSLTPTKHIRAVCAAAHTTRKVALICGAAGSGKTTALRQYAQENGGVYFIEVDQSMLLAGLAAEICRVLDLDYKGTLTTLSRRIQHKLRETDALLIFDECDYLTARILDWIRRVIHDKAQCGVILAGLPKLEHELHSFKNTHDQLNSRITLKYYVEKTQTKELMKIVSTIWPEMDAPPRKALVQAARGSLRVLHNLMSIAWLVARKTQTRTPTLEHIEEAIEMVHGQVMSAPLMEVA